MTERRIYLDANVFIYAIEGKPDIAALMRELFELFRNRRGIGVTSELSLAEVLPRAMDAHRRNYLNLILSSRIFNLQPVTREILIETADYRKAAGMPKLPDAIHMVTAIRSGCHQILSADARIKLPKGYSLIKPDRDSLSELIQELS